jgi:hypothetical protein
MLLHVVLANLGYLYLFWVLYVFTMGVYRAYLANRLTPFMLVLSAPFVLLAGLMDVVCNLTIATVLCLEMPKEWLVTQRFIRYLHDPKTAPWRKALAAYVCVNLLDVFDPDGNHCENLTVQQASTTPVRIEAE